jgi:hypothetical protein
MPIEEFVYKGIKAIIETKDTIPKVTLDGEEVPVFHDVVAGQYSTKYLPFATYDSLGALARAVIDQRKDSNESHSHR